MAQHIGIIANTQHGVFQRDVIAGVRSIVEAKGYTLSIDSRIDSSDPSRVTDLNINDLDGLLVIANVVPDEFLREVYQTGKPITLISHFVHDTPIPAVIPNNKQGITKLMEHLVVQGGRKNFVYINGDLNQHDGVERQDAFYKSIIRHNLPFSPDYMLRGDFEADVAVESLTQFLASGQPFDAIVAADYVMALAAIDVLQEEGYAVPEIAVTGFGDATRPREQNLTTIAADVTELGRRGARQLLGQMNGLKIQGTTLLSVNLVIRDTCGAPKRTLV